MEGMERIDSDIMDKVLTADESVRLRASYTDADVQPCADA